MIWFFKAAGAFLFDRFGGKTLLVGGGVAALLLWWQIDKAVATRSAFNEGAANAKQGFEQESGRLADRMGAAADRAAADDPHRRLRQRWCVDCEGR
jgi:hypothetical protein